ncbi:MAG: aspartate kinase [Gemmataceae bacterium]
MGLVVQKFGGTSVANATRIMAAARRAIRAHQEGNQVLVVVSARGDKTDELIDLARQLTDRPPARELDMLLATGEQESIALLAMAIHTLGEKAISLTGAQVGILTDHTHGKARIKEISTERMRRALAERQIVIVAGFQGIDTEFNITTLGRGGSDTTAVALAAVMKHDPTANGSSQTISCEIYTDVDGVYSTDPRIVPEAKKLEQICYEEMLELASAGAGVMHSRSIEFAMKFDVPVQVRSSFSDVEGTWIVPEAPWMTQQPVCGAALVKDEARITLTGVPDEPGVSHRIFQTVADRNIVVDMIAQNVGQGGKASIGFTVPAGELRATLEVLGPVARQLKATLEHDAEVSKVSIVGVGMRTQSGVAERMFQALSAENINLKMITTADIKISVLVDRRDGIPALRAVHRAFNLHQNRPGAGIAVPGPLVPNAGSRHDLAALKQRLADMEGILVSDVRLDVSQGRITLIALPDQAGNCHSIFQAVAADGINVDMIVQNLSSGLPELSFSVPLVHLDRALELTRQVGQTIDPGIQAVSDPNIATVNVLGVGMRTHTGVARRMFGALAARGINIAMINTSEVRLSVVVDRSRAEDAVTALKEEFQVP